MAHNGLSTGSLLYLLHHHTIRAGRALVLTQMFRPGIHEKRLQVSVRILEISKDSPSVCAVAPSNASVPVDRLDKSGHLFRVHVVFDGYHDGASVRGCS